jgi:hypothetical protein
MNKRSLILPVILLLCMAFVGWHAYSPVNQYTSGGPAMDQLYAEAQRINDLPAGTPFTVTFSDDTLTQAAEEALSLYSADIKAALQKLASMEIDVAKPKVEFNGDGTLKLSAKAGKGFLKVGASAIARINLINGIPEIQVEKVDVPLISISAETANSEIKNLTGQYMNYLTSFCSLSKIEITDGQIAIEGIKN